MRIVNNVLRHNFALRTCNGCHGAETGVKADDHGAEPAQHRGFRHISGRMRNERARLSEFMTGDPALVMDPTGKLHTFCDLKIRQQALHEALNPKPAPDTARRPRRRAQAPRARRLAKRKRRCMNASPHVNLRQIAASLLTDATPQVTIWSRAAAALARPRKARSAACAAAEPRRDEAGEARGRPDVARRRPDIIARRWRRRARPDIDRRPWRVVLRHGWGRQHQQSNGRQQYSCHSCLQVAAGTVPAARIDSQVRHLRTGTFRAQDGGTWQTSAIFVAAQRQRGPYLPRCSSS